jgi:hypothetical protein
MPDGFGLLNLAVSPFLERVSREERVGGDHPQKPRNPKPAPVRKNDSSNPLEESGNSEESVSPEHIDLRV